MTRKKNYYVKLSLKKHIRPLVLCCFFLLNATVLLAQTHLVKGIVTEKANGAPIPGVNIIVKGTTTGIITDINGNYQIEVGNDATLLFSFIGFKDREEVIGNRTSVDVQLESDVTALDEVVAIGYGTVRKKDLTGAVASVGENTLKSIPVASTAEAITGRMPGVQITTTEGSPDAEIKIRVRGGGSISQDNSPLYIVDGFQVSSISDVAPSDIESITILKDASATAIYGSQGANGVFQITTKSGKQGKVVVNLNAYMGVRKVTQLLDVLSPYEYTLYQHEIDQSDTFNKFYGVYEDLDIYKSIKGTNWQDKVFGRTAKVQNYNASISGGNETTKFNIGLNRSDEESIMIGSGFERTNATFKINTKLNESLSLDFNSRLSYTLIDGAGVSDGSGSTSRLRNSVKYAPTKGLREFDSTVEDDLDMNDAESSSLLFDPVQSTLDDYKNQERYRSTTNAAINWKIAKGLKFRSQWGVEVRYERTDRVWGPSTSQSKSKAGQPVSEIDNKKGLKWQTSNTLNYVKDDLFEGHSLNVLLGQEVVSSQSKSMGTHSEFFPADMTADDVLAMYNLGTPLPTETSIGAEENIESYFGRVIYNMYEKYLLTLTFRADGSSKFAPGNQWGYFPSAAFAWRITEENFMKSQDWLTNLKLRLSYGTAGNNRIKQGLWMASYRTTGDSRPYYTDETEDSYLIPSSTLYNPDLKWETTYTQNIGFDYGFFNNRISGTVDFYQNTTKDLLIQAPLATSSGYSNQYQNFGQTTNKGIEFSVEGYIIDRPDFSLSMNFNISFNKNNIDKFRNGNENFKTYSSDWNGSAQPKDDYIVQEGHPVGQMFGYVTDGMYTFDDFTFNAVYDEDGVQTGGSKWALNDGVADNSALISAGNYFGPGAVKFKDISGPDGTPDGIIDSYDKKIIGDANPIHTGGFGINARYKGFDLSAFFNWSYGNDVYNANKLDYSSYLLTRRYQNLSADMSLDKRFTTIDPVTGYNVYYGQYADPARLQELNKNASIWHPLQTQTVLHSWAIEDGSFLRLNNLTLGYTLPQSLVEKVNIKKLRLYVTGYNLFTWTNYSGFDPEVDTRRKTPMTPGVDYSAYPKSYTIIGGLNLTF